MPTRPSAPGTTATAEEPPPSCGRAPHRNWWREVGAIRPDEIEAKLTEANLDRHLNDYDAFCDDTPFLSTTASPQAPEARRPVGRLRVPIRFQRELVHAIARTVQDGPSDYLPQSTARYFERASETVGAAASDSYHWRNLFSYLLPIEMEALALAAAASLAWRDAGEERLAEYAHVEGWAEVALNVGGALAGETETLA